jgi:hypothetical protein
LKRRASVAGIGRSTASKALARLQATSEVSRTEGGRDGARPLPDRFALASAKPAAKASKPDAAEDTKPKAADDRLKPGQLDRL